MDRPLHSGNLLAAVASTAFSLVFAPCAWAQPAQSTAAQLRESDEAEAGLEEIIITAQKREENLQDVPVAVTVLTGKNLANANVHLVRGIAAPNSIPSPSRGMPTTLRPSFAE